MLQKNLEPVTIFESLSNKIKWKIWQFLENLLVRGQRKLGGTDAARALTLNGLSKNILLNGNAFIDFSF